MLLHRLPRDTKTQSSSPYGTSPFIREALNDSDPIYYILPGVDGVSEARKLFAEAAIPYWQRARALENLHRRYRSGDQGWRGRGEMRRRRRSGLLRSEAFIATAGAEIAI